MKAPFALLLLFATGAPAQAEIIPATFDLAAIRDASTLETRVLQDWRPAPKFPAIRQKLVEITIGEWWAGQKIRLPVTFNVPAAGSPCRNVIIGNMGLGARPVLPTGAMLRLLQEDGVGVVLVGMGTIDAMPPAGTLHRGMQAQLLRTKDARFTPAWIWGLSDMRALTAAVAEKDAFQPVKVLATGGSKRGIGAAAAGLHDDRFTAIMPIVAPPLGNPGGAFVHGSDPAAITTANRQFLADLAAGRISGLPETARAALIDRDERRGDERISVAQAQAAGWTAAEMAAMNDRAWDVSRIAPQLHRLRQRGLAVFYQVGTNDSVSPALVELGRRFPEFPLCIVPGGQHGGPKGAGFTRQVPTLPETEDNLLAFARHHFFHARPLPAAPALTTTWDAPSRTLRVTVAFSDGTEPQQNALAWSANRHAPHTLAFEYDRWQTTALTRTGPATFAGRIALPPDAVAVEIVSTHTHTAHQLPLALSSPLVRVETR